MPQAVRDAPDSMAGSASGTRSVSLERLCGGPGEDVGLAVELCDQAIDTVVFDDRTEFGTAGRYFADRAVEIDVGDQPIVAAAAHHVVDLDRLAIGLDDLALDYDARGRRLLAGDLQLLSVIAVKAVGID